MKISPNERRTPLHFHWVELTPSGSRGPGTNCETPRSTRVSPKIPNEDQSVPSTSQHAPMKREHSPSNSRHVPNGRLGPANSVHQASQASSSGQVVPRHRGQHAACRLGRYVYLLGGRERYSALADFWRLDTENQIWESIPQDQTRIPRLHGHSMLALQSVLLIFGGTFSDSGETTPFWIYNTESEELVHYGKDVGSTRPLGRREHSAVVYQASMFVYGGFLDDSGSTDQFWAFNIETGKWKQLQTGRSGSPVKSVGPGNRHGHVAVVDDAGVMWLHGGMRGLRPLSDLWRYQFGNNTWIKTNTLGSCPVLSNHTAHVIDSTIVVLGNAACADQICLGVWLFQIESSTWKRVSSIHGDVPPALTYHASVLLPINSSASLRPPTPCRSSTWPRQHHSDSTTSELPGRHDAAPKNSSAPTDRNTTKQNNAQNNLCWCKTSSHRCHPRSDRNSFSVALNKPGHSLRQIGSNFRDVKVYPATTEEQGQNATRINPLNYKPDIYTKNDHTTCSCQTVDAEFGKKLRVNLIPEKSQHTIPYFHSRFTWKFKDMKVFPMSLTYDNAAPDRPMTVVSGQGRPLRRDLRRLCKSCSALDQQDSSKLSTLDYLPSDAIFNTAMSFKPDEFTYQKRLSAVAGQCACLQQVQPKKPGGTCLTFHTDSPFLVCVNCCTSLAYPSSDNSLITETSCFYETSVLDLNVTRWLQQFPVHEMRHHECCRQAYNCLQGNSSGCPRPDWRNMLSNKTCPWGDCQCLWRTLLARGEQDSQGESPASALQLLVEDLESPSHLSEIPSVKKPHPPAPNHRQADWCSNQTETSGQTGDMDDRRAVSNSVQTDSIIQTLEKSKRPHSLGVSSHCQPRTSVATCVGSSKRGAAEPGRATRSQLFAWCGPPVKSQAGFMKDSCGQEIEMSHMGVTKRQDVETNNSNNSNFAEGGSLGRTESSLCMESHDVDCAAYNRCIVVIGGHTENPTFVSEPLKMWQCQWR